MIKDPSTLIQVSTVQLRDDGVIQIIYEEPSQQSNSVTRIQDICFEGDVVDHELLDWLEATETMIARALFVQDEEDKPNLRPR